MENVLHILGHLFQGGAETYTLRYINFDKDNKHYILCRFGETGPLEAEFAKHAVIIKNIKFGYFGGNIIRFIKFIKKERITAVWSPSENIPFLLTYFLRINKRILFYRTSSPYWGNDPYGIKKGYHYILRKLCAYSATMILSNSKTAFERFHPSYNKRPDRYQVIYNGVPSDAISTITKQQIRNYLQINDESFVIGHSGRYDKAKNHEMIIKVAIELCKKHKDIIFILLGLDVDKRYQSVVDENNLSRQIRLLGYRKDAKDILKSFDLFYFPSIIEGQPNALIEAMVSGIPFLASNISPIKECVPEEFIPKLISPNNYNQNINTIEKLYLNRELLNSYKCERWAIDHYNAERQFQLFKDVIDA